MRKILLLFVFVINMYSLHANNDTIYRNISIVQSDSLIQTNTGSSNFIIIDIREANYFAISHIANAINIDYYDPNFTTLLDTLDHSKKYLIYCRSGNRSGFTITMMQNKHFKEVYNMLGGINAWIAAGYPVVVGIDIIDNNLKNFSSIVYPNPISSNSVIQVNSYCSIYSQLEIYDMSGKKIYTIPLSSDIISLSELTFKNGAYFYLITAENKILNTGNFEVTK